MLKEILKLFSENLYNLQKIFDKNINNYNFLYDGFILRLFRLDDNNFNVEINDTELNLNYNKVISNKSKFYDTLLEYSSDTWSLDLYDDIYSISPPGEYLAIDAIVGTFIAGKLKVGRTIILESSYDLYDEYILENYKYKNGTNPNSIVHKI